ncbi:hypothetical protein PEDI_22510 [Persicobacter diffluens]|uniref:Uncharacterized protein n=1 Tax=Persicobacter diffluens TaxID=981 RepID=A0AAN4VYR3_9BACT|nr:hypothetical protein PEDI_22510 [Persicobacter diffluens]
MTKGQKNGSDLIEITAFLFSNDLKQIYPHDAPLSSKNHFKLNSHHFGVADRFSNRPNCGKLAFSSSFCFLEKRNRSNPIISVSCSRTRLGARITRLNELTQSTFTKNLELIIRIKLPHKLQRDNGLSGIPHDQPIGFPIFHILKLHRQWLINRLQLLSGYTHSQHIILLLIFIRTPLA